MERKKQGFTLIELLVVISIIALLLAILMPALGVAKKRAEETVCKSNVKQWAMVFIMYATDNNDKFWKEYNVWAADAPTQGGWMPMLADLYGDVDDFRLCPSARKKKGVEGGMGGRFFCWGPGKLMQMHKFGGDMTKNYGSYGVNLWINDYSASGGWRGLPQLQWVKSSSPGAYNIPMIGDSVWFGGNPMSLNDTNRSGNTEKIPDSPDFYDNMSDPAFGDIIWGYDMGRMAINRHNMGVNLSFMDGSARKVRLTDVYSLKWHKEFALMTSDEVLANANVPAWVKRK